MAIFLEQKCSSAEVKAAGFASGDPDLIDKFNKGEDINFKVSLRSDSRKNKLTKCWKHLLSLWYEKI